MKDTKTTVQELKDLCNTFVAEREWHQFHAPKNLSMAIAAEAAELMEKFMWVEASESREIMRSGDEQFKQEVADELADVIAAALMFACECKIDISTAVAHKMEKNRQKYPIEKSKGRWTKYNNL